MLVAPVAGEGLDDGLFGGLAAGLAEASQGDRIALTGYHRPQDLLAGNPGDVGEDVVKLQVHLLERLLHMQDVGGAMLDELGAATEEGT
jgi:hypothetical protein